jgi:inosine-uridine nucleoside N-ribohydrolase
MATGPLTNVAYAFELHPELPGLLARLVLMGGAYGLTSCGKGNRTPYAEFNIWQDPEAAHIVFNSGADIFAMGLDVTMDPTACLNGQHLEQIKTRYTPAAHLVAQLVEYEVKYHGCCRMHDPLALATLLDASLLDFTLAKVEVVKGNDWDRGVTRILPAKYPKKSRDFLGTPMDLILDLPSPHENRNVFLDEASSSQLIHVASAVDGPRFLKLFLSRILEE